MQKRHKVSVVERGARNRTGGEKAAGSDDLPRVLTDAAQGCIERERAGGDRPADDQITGCLRDRDGARGADRTAGVTEAVGDSERPGTRQRAAGYQER